MKAISKTQQHHPDIRFHIYSGNAQYVEEKLDQGIFDLGIVTDPADLSKYDYLKLPTLDTWGVLMKKDSELAHFETISPKDLLDKPMIISNQEILCLHFCFLYFNFLFTRSHIVVSFDSFNIYLIDI